MLVRVLAESYKVTKLLKYNLLIIIIYKEPYTRIFIFT